jgi:membrane-associated phospholipid phosphatase
VRAVKIEARRLLAACLASAAALALLAWATYELSWFRHRDAVALAHLSADRLGRLGDVAGPIADLGDPLPQVLLLLGGIVVALVAGRRRAALAGAVLVLGADLTTAVLKQALAAPRLDAVLGWAQVGENSFPSGHATAAFAMAAAWLVFVPARWRPLTAAVGLLLASAVAAAVVVLRYHFPSDVVGGLLVAAMWTFGVCAVLALCSSAQESEKNGASFEA